MPTLTTGQLVEPKVTDGEPSSTTVEPRLTNYFRFRKGLILLLLLASYTASYVVTSTLSIATPMITTTLGFSNSNIGLMVTVSTAARIAPKFLSGVIADYAGGKMLLTTSMLAMSVMCGAVAAFPYLWWMIAVWSLVRVTQTFLWPAIVKISARWFAQTEMGTALSLFNLSFLVALVYLQVVVILTQDWRIIFVSSGAMSLAVTIVLWVLLRESPHLIGMPEPPTDPRNMLGDQGDDAQVNSWREIFIPIFSNPGFWLLALYYSCTNLIRQVLLDWTPLFLTQTTNCSSEYAAGVFLSFTLVGAVSSMIFGVLNDRVGTVLRNVICIVFAFLTSLVLAANTALIYFDPIEDDFWNLICFSILNGMIAFFLLGPFSLPSSVMSVRYGGKKICATVSSTLDGIATVVALLSGPVGGVSGLQEGWFWVFFLMTGMSFLSIFLMTIYSVVDKFNPLCDCCCKIEKVHYSLRPEVIEDVRCDVSSFDGDDTSTDDDNDHQRDRLLLK